MLPAQVEANTSAQTEIKDPEEKSSNDENKDLEINKSESDDKDNIAIENNL